MWTLRFSKRRASIVEEASKSRADAAGSGAALMAVVVYNLIGLLDIYSTSLGLAAGLGEEANPVIRAAMDHFGPGWIAAKLVLQALISAMVLWFPHRIVVGIFAVAVAFNAGIVWSNLRIAGLF